MYNFNYIEINHSLNIIYCLAIINRKITYNPYFKTMISFLFHYFFALLFMLCLTTADVLSYFLLEQHATYFLLGFLIAYYWYHESPTLMTYGTFLLMVESFIIHDSYFLIFLSALPAFAIIRAIKERLYITPIQPLITFFIASCIDLFIVKGILKQLPLSPFYTIGILCGNLVVIWVFSLKLNGGKTRQSLMPFA